MTQTESAARFGSFPEICESHYDPMIRLAYPTTASLPAAEGIVQDAFADLHRVLSRVDDPGRWLHRAVANRSTSWLRRPIVARRHLGRAHRALDHPPPGSHIAVRQALAGLPPRDRAAVFLRFYLHMSEVDIAEGRLIVRRRRP